MRELRRLASVVAALGVILAVARPAVAADTTFTLSPEPGRDVYDEAGVLTSATVDAVLIVSGAATDATGVAPIVYLHRVPAGGPYDAAAAAEALVRAWSPAMPRAARTAVLLYEVAGDPACPVDVALHVGPDYAARLPQAAADALVATVLRPAIGPGCDPNGAVVAGVSNLAMAVAATPGASPGASPGGTGTGPAAAPPAGPPYPAPEAGRRVYDYAGVFTPDTISQTEATIHRIETRTGAQIAVFTQLKPGADTSSTEEDAIALMDQWGVGRKGFDDGLVILWNLDGTLRHGQVQLYAGPGFRNLVSNEQRQAIYNDDMLPLLRDGNLNGAMVAAMGRLDDLMTPENAARLQLYRTLNAILGLVGAPVLFLLAAGWAVFHWVRYGRDPYVAPSESIHMPAPPPQMTAAAGAFVMAGEATRRALTAAMLDLASRGEIAFRQEEQGLIFHQKKLVLTLTEPNESDPRIALNRRKPIGPAETFALGELRKIAEGSGTIEPPDLLKFGKSVGDFDSKLEKTAVAAGWFTRSPSSVQGRWIGLGVTEIVGAVILFILAMNLPSDGLTLVSIGLGAGGIVTAITGKFMPARTLQGSMARIWLNGYRQTLRRTMEQARSMDQVVATAGLDWLETPDQAIVWGTALGLHDEIEQVLGRSVEDLRGGTVSPTAVYLPFWYTSPAAGGWGAGPVGATGIAPGLMAGSAIPDFGGMMSALGSIGNSPSSSGGGGFGGGGSGGGGGGAGGGF